MTQFFGENTFKFGVFGLNCAGGMTPSRAPNRWRADWEEIAAVARLADEAGIEFLLPIAKWHGLGGQADMWGRSFETFSQAAALGALTRRVGIFVTAHVSLLTPAFAAKAIATLDHITKGRAGLNVVCGWNPDEFSLHGVKLEGEHRYSKGAEWLEIYNKLIEGEGPFDWSGEFFQMSGLVTDPLPLQRPRPPTMSAAQSGDGQLFAARFADILFTAMYTETQVGESIRLAKNQASAFGRQIEVYATTQIVCRPSRKEAQDYLNYYAIDMADPDAIEYFARQRDKTVSTSTKAGATAADREMRSKVSPDTRRPYPGLFPSMFPICGSPDDIADKIALLSNLGLAGSTLVFLNYLEEMPYFVQEVLPRLERLGLRHPTSTIDAGALAHGS